MVYATRWATVNLQKNQKQLKTQSVIGVPVTAESFETQMDTILDWAQQRLSKVVCVANVHMLIEAKHNFSFARILHRADIITPDGMPLAWLTSWINHKPQDRVAGMDILLNLCRQATQKNVGLFFLGSTPQVLGKIQNRLDREYPNLPISGMEALPFRPLTYEEDEALIRRLNNSGAGVILISLGCPKQERWMHAHKHRVNAVMIGIGGVFPVFAGLQKWAPAWVRKSGLEWLYRLVQEPQRLWKRYATTIPLFLWLGAKQLVKVHLGLEPANFTPTYPTMILVGTQGRR